MQAWLVVFGAWCAMISAMGLLNTLAVLQAWVSEHQLHGMPESAIGWIFSTYGFFIYFCGAQIGESGLSSPTGHTPNHREQGLSLTPTISAC